MIPAWLLARTGGNLRAASISLCARCSKPILRGLDDERAALPARVDITPVDEFGEALALIQGRMTYDLIGGAQKKELELRYEWHINKPRRYPVHAAHKCWTPPLATAPSQVPAILTEAETDDIPF
ncbi:hypothetical protein [Streptosporangium sp. NPDC049078]|uniref:hypothetical protein n=1 Tax=Streptosporangium sp. NPDC049078 TaxID=3155767 RepID=UPI0034398F9E